MRKLYFLFLLVVVAITTSCNKQDELGRPSRPTRPDGKASISIAGDGMVATRSSGDRVEFTGGYATGAGLYDGDAKALVAAVPYSGYQLSSFTGGTVGGNGNQFSGSNQYNFDINSQDWRFSVTFKKEFQITVSAGEGGRVTGGGTVLEGENCTVVAYPESGYTFDGWYESGSKVSSLSTYIFAVSSNRTMT